MPSLLQVFIDQIIPHEEHKPNYAGFVVIGAGLPRTGTLSMRAALNKILDGACYHMVSVINGTKLDVTHWENAFNNKVTDMQWIHFLANRGFRAGVDYPIAFFYKDLMRAFPKAKVVLTVRDPEKWYLSVKDSIQVLVEDNVWPMRMILMLAGADRNFKITHKVGYSRPPGFELSMHEAVAAGKEEAVKFYNKWVQEVKQNVPEDRLLVFDVRQGWHPLCSFLGLQIPEEPFPRLNDKLQMQRGRKKVKLLAYLLVYGLPLIFAFSMAFLYQHSISSSFASYLKL